ncbi:MAG: hypothetical protein ACRD0J_05025 [Acidimicrobiales bacterium]
MPTPVGAILEDVELQGAAGEPVRLSRFLCRPTIVQCLRYYG